jgi:hypothetical protein
MEGLFQSIGEGAADCGGIVFQGDGVLIGVACGGGCIGVKEDCEKELKGEGTGAEPNCGMSRGVSGLGVVEIEE